MIHYKYSRSQLEAKAEELLKQFDAERLLKTKPIDVYAVIEKCLGVPYDWKYLTPDQSILGLTAFSEGYIYVWHKPYFEEGMLPHKLFLEKGTIVIDSTLTEDTNQGRENFTVMHEVFHQVLHKNCFCKEAATYAHETTKSAIQGGKRKLKTSLDFIEYQANTCAAAFLMPESLTKRVFNKKMLESPLSRTNKLLSEILIAEMADEFSVSNKAMKYRLQNLKLI